MLDIIPSPSPEMGEDEPGDLAPPRMPQQARSREKRERLLEAAKAIFTEYGYEGATIDAIAERAEVSVGIFYRYFRSKRQILLTLIVERIERDFVQGQPVPDHAPITLPLLEETLWYYLRRARENTGMRRARQELALLDAEFAAYDRRRYVLVRQKLTEALERRKHLGELRADLECQGTAFALLALFTSLRDGLLEAPEELWRPPIAATARLLYHALIPDSQSQTPPETADPQPSSRDA